MITAFFRTVLLYALLIVGLRLTGKRQIGQLEPIEFVLMMLLSDLASVPMQDFGLPLLQGIIPIATLLALSTLLSGISLLSVRFRSLICGEPTIIVRDGVLQQTAMKRSRLTLDEVLEELRVQGVSSLADVKYAVLETSGQLSVLHDKWLQKQLKAHKAHRVQDVFLMTVDRGGSVVLAKKESVK